MLRLASRFFGGVMASRTVPAKKRRPAIKRTITAGSDFVPDEYGAQGGMPSVPSLTPVDRSAKRRVTQELSWAEFDRQVRAMALAARRYKPTAVVGLAHGGVFVGGAIASALKVEFFPVRLMRRSRDTSQGSLPEDLPRALKGQTVLLVDDVAGSGDSLELAVRLAKAVGVKKTLTAALVQRPDGFRPDFAAYDARDFFVFPWDYAEVMTGEALDPTRAGA